MARRYRPMSASSSSIEIIPAALESTAALPDRLTAAWRLTSAVPLLSNLIYTGDITLYGAEMTQSESESERERGGGGMRLRVRVAAFPLRAFPWGSAAGWTIYGG